MQYCSRCVYPQVAYLLQVDDEGVCSACRVEEKFQQLTQSFWDERRRKFESLLSESKKLSKSNYDCIVPVCV